MKADAVVNVVNLTKKYGDVTVLDGLNLRVERGQTVALLGPNGAGKTTTVEIIRGLVPRNAGSVEVFGENPTNNSNPLWQARIGMALQAQRDHAKWRVMEFLNWIRASYEGIRDCRDVSELIDSFDLGKHAYKTISTLSGGCAGASTSLPHSPPARTSSFSTNPRPGSIQRQKERFTTSSPTKSTPEWHCF